jgi:hypothetical protein
MIMSDALSVLLSVVMSLSVLMSLSASTECRPFGSALPLTHLPLAIVEVTT